MQEQPIAETDITDEEIAEFISGEPPFHTILEVWREVLSPAEKERNASITPQWASRICSKYGQLTYADMPVFRDWYFDSIAELRDILLAEISLDDESLNQATAEEDAEHNGAHYLNVLTNWQLAVLRWELEWDCTHPEAAASLAAIAEVHAMFFGEVGLTSLLDQIPFQFTEEDQKNLGQALQEFKEGWEGDGE